MLVVTCPHCAAKWKVPDRKDLRAVAKCLKCGKRFSVGPALSTEEAAGSEERYPTLEQAGEETRPTRPHREPSPAPTDSIPTVWLERVALEGEKPPVGAMKREGEQAPPSEAERETGSAIVRVKTSAAALRSLSVAFALLAWISWAWALNMLLAALGVSPMQALFGGQALGLEGFAWTFTCGAIGFLFMGGSYVVRVVLSLSEDLNDVWEKMRQ